MPSWTPDPSLAALRVVLLQARDALTMERQEQTCFLERCRLRPPQLVARSVLRDPLTPALLDSADALLIGGAGAYSATDDHPWMPALLALVQTAVERRLPTFGSCWGHQVIARALGGTVVHDPEAAELGCRTVHLTAAGRRDPLFRAFPARFTANMGHHDRVRRLPPGAVELAANDQPHQAFRLRRAPVYGTQFHSELDADRERERLIHYRDHYREDLPSAEEFEAVLNSLAPTTAVDGLLHRFLCVHAAGA